MLTSESGKGRTLDPVVAEGYAVVGGGMAFLDLSVANTEQRLVSRGLR
jgi:hypothetical protein